GRRRWNAHTGGNYTASRRHRRCVLLGRGRTPSGGKKHMKRITSAVIAVSLVAFVPGAGLAQTTSGTKSATVENDNRTKHERPEWKNSQGLHETGYVIGASVEGAD